MTPNESYLYRPHIKQYMSPDISEEAMLEMDCLMLLSPDALQICDQYVVDLVSIDFELPPPAMYMWEKSLNPDAVIPRHNASITRTSSFHEKPVAAVPVRYETISKMKIWLLAALLAISAATALFFRGKYKDATRKDPIHNK